MYNRRTIFILIVAIIISISALATLTWANYNYSVQNPGGNDFLVHWHGTRAFILDKISPYSDEVATRIQVSAYGRPARQGEHELRVAYPLYSVLIYAPYALISDYSLARAVWMTSLELGLILLALISLRLTEWKSNIAALTIFLIFSVLWYHAVRPVILGNAVVLVSLMMVGALLAIKQERDRLAGILLGLATIKPQLVVVLIPFVFVWAISKKRWRIIGWTVGAILVFTILGMIFIPDWILQNIGEVIRYPGYNPPGTPGAAFVEWFPDIGRYLGFGLTILLALVLIREWIVAWGQGFRWFLWVSCLTLVTSQWIGIQTDPGNFIILYLPLVLILAGLQERWGERAGIIISIGGIFTVFLGIWMIFLSTVGSGPQPRQHSIMFFPLPLILLMGLYFIRSSLITSKDQSIESKA